MAVLIVNATIEIIDTDATVLATGVRANVQSPTDEQVVLAGGIVRYKLAVDPGPIPKNEHFIRLLTWDDHSPDTTLQYPVQGMRESGFGRLAIRKGWIAGEIQ